MRRISVYSKTPLRTFSFLLGFLVIGVLLAPLAELGHLKTGLELLLVLVGVVVHPVALGAFELDEILLRHIGYIDIAPPLRLRLRVD
jgi:predicted membrane protein